MLHKECYGLHPQQTWRLPAAKPSLRLDTWLAPERDGQLSLIMFTTTTAAITTTPALLSPDTTWAYVYKVDNRT